MGNRTPVTRPHEAAVEALHNAYSVDCFCSNRAATRDRNLDAIQCIEAIRIYTAVHGKFPAGLDQITEAPVPLDSGTGKPFSYQLEGEGAIVSASYPPGASCPASRNTRFVTR